MSDSSNGGNTAGFSIDPLTVDIDTVLDIQRAALKSLKDGFAYVEFSGNGTSAKMIIQHKPLEVLAQCNRYLKLYAPETYGHVVRQSNQIRLG